MCVYMQKWSYANCSSNAAKEDKFNSVLSEGLNFVLFSKKPNKISVKQGVEKFPGEGRSVLSKGLNFVPISEKPDEFSFKQDVENILRRVQLNAFFTIRKTILTPRTKTLFKTLQSKWTPPEGQFAS